MIPAGAILIAIMHLPVCWADRADARVPGHLARIAYAISEEAKDADEASALISISKNESNNCIAVQDHYTHSGALSMWQLENKQRKYKGPFLGLEYDPIHNAAHAALDVWRHSGGCPGGVSGKFRVYGGRNCDEPFPSLANRLSVYWFAYGVISGYK